MEVCKPIENGYISSGYGWRSNPFDTTKRQFHPGIDVSCKEVKPIVRTPLSGTVVEHGFSKSFGNRVWIKIEDVKQYVKTEIQTHEKNDDRIREQLNCTIASMDQKLDMILTALMPNQPKQKTK